MTLGLSRSKLQHVFLLHRFTLYIRSTFVSVQPITDEYLKSVPADEGKPKKKTINTNIRQQGVDVGDQSKIYIYIFFFPPVFFGSPSCSSVSFSPPQFQCLLSTNKLSRSVNSVFSLELFLTDICHAFTPLPSSAHPLPT